MKGKTLAWQRPIRVEAEYAKDVITVRDLARILADSRMAQSVREASRLIADRQVWIAWMRGQTEPMRWEHSACEFVDGMAFFVGKDANEAMCHRVILWRG